MPETTIIPGNLDIQGNLRVRGTGLPYIPRTSLQQDDLAVFPIHVWSFRVWDAFATNLPATSASDDLGVYGSSFGTYCPYIATSDLKAAGATTRYARALVQVPLEYVAGQTLQIRCAAGMLTTVADTTATLDVEIYKLNRDTLITGSDLCATSAQSINSTTFAEKTFELTTTTLSPGDWLDLRIAVAVNDAASGTAVIGAIAAVDLMADIQG